MAKRFSVHHYLLSVAAALMAVPGTAQLLGGAGGVVREVTGTVGGITGPILGQPQGSDPVSGAIPPVRATLSGVGNFVAPSLSPSTLLELRKARQAQLLAANRTTLERDDRGQPVRRGQLVAIEPTNAQISAAAVLGFAVIGDQRDPLLGMRMVTFSTPRSTNVRKSLERLRKGVRGIDADYDHIYEPAGGALLPTAGVLAAAATPRSGLRIAMIDGGVAAHASLARATIVQKGFAGPAQSTGHGTAVASLLVGDDGPFRGAARGSSLFVGDIYGGNPAAGSASAIVRALGWAASKQPTVITISLVGPENRVFGEAIAALQRRGISVVAAVGNDGPAAPPAYPASFDGVVAVTGVDARGKALIEAGRARHLDFAAPGADLAAATPGRGYARVRGTSFAAPLAAARLASVGSLTGLAAEARPGKGKVGRGIVCGSCAIAPRLVGAK